MKKNFMEWWRMNNMKISAITGETFTNGEVVLTHIGLMVFLIILGLAGNY